MYLRMMGLSRAQSHDLESANSPPQQSSSGGAAARRLSFRRRSRSLPASSAPSADASSSSSRSRSSTTSSRSRIPSCGGVGTLPSRRRSRKASKDSGNYSGDDKSSDRSTGDLVQLSHIQESNNEGATGLTEEQVRTAELVAAMQPEWLTISEIIEHIFLHLDVKSLGRCAQVCRAFDAARWLRVDLRPFRRPLRDEALRYIVSKSPRQLWMPRKRWSPLLAPIVISSHTLRSLDMHKCELTVQCVEHLALGLLSLHQTIVHMDLSHNAFSDSGAAVIFSALKDNHSLRTLNLTRCQLTLVCASSLSSMLKHNSTLEKLSLSNNKLPSAAINVLAQGLKENTALKALDLSTNEFDDTAGRFIADILTHNTTLEHLSIGDNLHQRGTQAVFEALCVNTSLKSLEIESSKVSAEDTRVLAVALKKNKTLKALNLRDNGMLDNGARHVCEGLMHNNTLESLNMDFIGLSYMNMYDKVIVNCENLRFLSIRFNRMHLSCASALANALSNARCLQELRMDDCGLTPEVLERLKEVRGNTTVTHLSVRHNPLNDASVPHLIRLALGFNALRVFDVSARPFSDPALTMTADNIRTLLLSIKDHPTLTTVIASNHNIPRRDHALEKAVEQVQTTSSRLRLMLDS